MTIGLLSLFLIILTQKRRRELTLRLGDNKNESFYFMLYSIFFNSFSDREDNF